MWFDVIYNCKGTICIAFSQEGTKGLDSYPEVTIVKKSGKYT